MDSLAAPIGYGLVGYFAGWIARTRFRPRIAPSAFLSLAIILFVVTGVLANRNENSWHFERMVGTERLIFNVGFCSMLAAAPASSWMAAKTPWKSATIAASIWFATLVGGFVILVNFACGWFGDCL
jgi:hypothetical protein